MVGTLGRSGQVRDLVISGVSLVARNYGQIAYVSGGNSISVIGVVSVFGGLVGINEPSGLVANSSSSARIVVGAGSSDIGGLVGQNYGSIVASYVTINGSLSAGANSRNIGGLVGANLKDGAIDKSYALDSSVAGYANVGELIGYNAGTITNSYAGWGPAEPDFDFSHVTGATRSTAIGGLVGQNAGSIMGSFALGVVTGGASSDYVGGLVGDLLSGTLIKQSYSYSAVSGHLDVGGLIGRNGGSVAASYHPIGTVTGDSASLNIGGLVGLSLNSGSIDQSFAASAATGHGDLGGLVGRNDRQYHEFIRHGRGRWGRRVLRNRWLDRLNSGPSRNRVFDRVSYGLDAVRRFDRHHDRWEFGPH